MQIQIQCQICGKKLAKYACAVCGAQVCEDCFDKASGKCLNCKIGKRMKK